MSSLAGEENKGVLVIYTGGTIGSMPKDPNDSESPQVVISWKKFRELTPQLDEQRLGFKIDAYSTKPLDSCNIGPKEWKEMADAIKDNYDDYEGFVILHGTDTMVYTASVLSFMLRNLAKPVIVTGAQLAFLFNERNDGYQNMITALMIANPKFSKIPTIPEVMIYFSGKLFRGNRTRKTNSTGFSAYESKDYPLLGVADESIEIDTRLIRKNPQNRVFKTRTRLETNVVLIQFFPGIQDGKILERILNDPNLKGVVLGAYGAGNIPTDKHVLDLLKKATDKDIVILDVTQCGGGRVELGMYETSALLLDVGVVSGIDITPEAALTKMMALLGDEDMDAHEVALKVQQDMAGEQSMSIFTTEFKSTGACSVDSGMPRHRIPAGNVEGAWANPDELETIVLRFRSGKIITGSAEYVEIKLFVDLSSDDDLDENSPNFLGVFKRGANENPTILFFDITERTKGILGKRSSFTVVFASEEGSLQWESVELAIFRKEI